MRPSPPDRAALDAWIAQLAKLSDGLTLDDFRLDRICEAKTARRRARLTLYVGGAAFMLVLLAELALSRGTSKWTMLWCGAWSMALGGLGAVASLFVTVLRISPDTPSQKTEELEIIGRIFLGCLFSLVFALVVIPIDLMNFLSFITIEKLDDLRKTPFQVSPKLLLPFLCGYSIPLVLGILGKAIQAIELTLGFDDNAGNRLKRTRRRSTI